MKKKYLAGLALLCCTAAGTPAMAQQSVPSTSSEIYDFNAFQDSKMLELFYQALQHNRNYPTPEEFEAAGFNMMDVEFVRSHVRPRAILSREGRLDKKVPEERDLFLNIPMGTSKGIGGYPSSVWNNDVFSMWNYTNLFGAWNHGVFQAPGCWVDAGHKHGTDVMSGIKFFESWTAGSGAGGWAAMISEKDSQGNYKYAEPLINCLMYFGADGINYNWEDASYDTPAVVGFHKKLYQLANERGFNNFHIAIYTSNQLLTTATAESLFGTTKNGKTTDLMLNYMDGDFTGLGAMRTSVTTAKRAMGTTKGLYAGVWIVGMDRSWSNLAENPAMNVCLWGEHANSRFWSYNEGGTNQEAQNNYQKLLERAFSGGNRAPLNRPVLNNNGNNWQFQYDNQGNVTKYPLQTFCGLAEFVPERSTVYGDLPFQTHFCLGNGEKYMYKGKVTTGTWYNVGQQDMVPTYRWLVTAAGTNTVSNRIQPEFTHTDAYVGGSSLLLKGTCDSKGSDIHLYRTDLKVSSTNPVAKIAVKNVKGAQPTNLYVIVKKKGAAAWQECAVGSTTSNKWEEKVLKIDGLTSGDAIESIGLRVKGADNGNYQLLVGKLEISDDKTVAPKTPTDLMVEVREETQTSLSVKMNWKVEGAGDRNAWNLLYNDEANIDHFEIMYKNGANGRISEIGRTSSWATYVGNIIFEGTDDEPYIGVRAASVDMKSYSPIEWVKVSRSNSDNLKELLVDNYGIVAVDHAAAGFTTACEQRFVERVTTKGADQNLNYSASAPTIDADSTLYTFADRTKHVLKVKQGQKVSIKIKGHQDDDDLRYCFINGYMDFDGSGSFDGRRRSDEVLFRHGEFAHSGGYPEMTAGGISFNFTVPADAHCGTSRLRLVFSDLWFAPPVPMGYTNKGCCLDFEVQISGTNAERQPEKGTLDEGIADEPEGLGGQTGIGEVTDEVSAAQVNGDELVLTNVEKAWVYTLDGKFVQFVQHGQNVNIANYTPGVYLVKMVNKRVIRTQKIVVE